MLDLMKGTRADAPKPQSALTWSCWSQEEMAACPDVLAISRVVVGNILLLVLSSNPVWGESITIPSSSTFRHK